jgi:hypothetical protein
MKQIRLILTLAAVFFIGYSHADTIDRSNDIEESDIQALREWIYAKRQVTIGEKGGALSISGEVRVEFQQNYETKNGVPQRGIGRVTDRSNREYDIEVNIMMDYRTERTWASIKLEFDNDAGIIDGTLNKLKLERAFIGLRMLDCEDTTADWVMGRNRMGSFFDSKVEFGSFFDGILIKYDRTFEDIGNFYIHPGVFIVNERRDHYAYVAEIGLLDIADTGFYTKYSIIDWNTKHYPKTRKVEIKGKEVIEIRKDNERYDFLVSQVILGYKFISKTCEKPVVIYAAGLYNHNARKLKLTDHKKANVAAYTGFSIGSLQKSGDWAWDANYQVVGAQAVPDFDNSGIGIGNADNSGLYTKRNNGDGGPNTRKTAGGNDNYRGFALTFEYLITNNLNMFQQYQQSITLDSHIGPFRRYKQYELEFIYLF